MLLKRLFRAALALLLLVSAGLGWLRLHRAPPATACPPPKDALTLPAAAQEETPVFFSHAAGARFVLDGAPFEKDAVALLAPGRHTLRAEAAPARAAELSFGVDAFHPGLFDAEGADGAVSLVFLGVTCESCPKGGGPEALMVEPASQPFAQLEAGATEALARGDWPAAAALLRQVQPGERSAPGFLRPAAYVLQASGAHAEAKALVAALKGDALVQSRGHFEEAVKTEAAREHDYLTRRWNALTEVYARLLALEGGDPAAVQQASQALADASSDFARASRQGDARAEHRVVETAEDQVHTLVRQLRAARPLDCEFQARVDGAL